VRKPKYTREQLADAVSASTSVRQVLIRLNVAPYGGNYGVLRRALSAHGIDTSHFVGRGWSLGRTLPSRKPLDAHLRVSSSIQSFKLKRRLARRNDAKYVRALRLGDMAGQPNPTRTRPYQR
jgi:hypothetical protein